MSPARVLLIGYGNPGRQDDGLGPALAEAIAARAWPGVTVDADYQLMIDDAASFCDQDLVILADAALSGPEPFSVARVIPEHTASFTSHGVTAPELAGMAKALFQAEPPVYLIAIRGYLFDTFEERLSPGARANLEATLLFLEGVLLDGRIEALREACPPAPCDPAL